MPLAKAPLAKATAACANALAKAALFGAWMLLSSEAAAESPVAEERQSCGASQSGRLP